MRNKLPEIIRLGMRIQGLRLVVPKNLSPIRKLFMEQSKQAAKQSFAVASSTLGRIPPTPSITVGLPLVTVASLLSAAAFLDSKSNADHLSLHKINELQQQNRIIIAVGSKVYDVTDFVADHPGGATVLKRANGHNIESIWSAEEYNFHRTSTNVQDFLEQYYIGDLQVNASLPELPIDKIRSALPKKSDEQRFQVHNALNKEAREFLMVLGVTEDFFVRNHGNFPAEQSTFNVGGVTLAYQELGNLRHTDLNASIICGGAGRGSDFPYPGVKGRTPWGLDSEGHRTADAIGTMHIKSVPLSEALKLANIKLEDGDLIKITGSDDYYAVVHSSELANFSLAMQQTDGSPLPTEHGRELRSFGKGTPGFRNIKSVANITLIKPLSHEEIDKELVKRLGNPMPQLEQWKRELLAACPKYDSYVLKDEQGKAYNFFAYRPVSSKITTVIREGDTIKVEGIAYSGEHALDRVSVGIKGLESQSVKVVFPEDGDRRFGTFSHELYAPESLGKVTITTQAFDEKDQSQVIKMTYNNAGLFSHRQIAACELSSPRENEVQKSAL